MRILTGFLLGVVATTGVLSYVFVNTTLSYRSTLFEGERVVVKPANALKTWYPSLVATRK